MKSSTFVYVEYDAATFPLAQSYFYESIASCDVQSVVDYEEVTLVEMNPQSKSKTTSCKEFKYDLVLNLTHLEKILKTQIKYYTSNKPIDYISTSTML